MRYKRHLIAANPWSTRHLVGVTFDRSYFWSSIFGWFMLIYPLTSGRFPVTSISFVLRRSKVRARSIYHGDQVQLYAYIYMHEDKCILSISSFWDPKTQKHASASKYHDFVQSLGQIDYFAQIWLEMWILEHFQKAFTMSLFFHI